MKIDRLLSIIMVLLDKERVSAQKLAEMFEVSVRTIYRDIDSIDIAGIPIRSIAGVGGGFEIMPNYKLDNKVFSTADLSSILLGLSNMSNMMQDKELINAMAKIKSFIPQEQAQEIELKANQIHIDLTPWMGCIDFKTSLDLIKKALEQSKLLSFDYADRYDNKTSRTIEPYQLVLKGNDWYTQGYCLTRNDYRLFKLARISNLTILSESFEVKDYKKPMLEFDDILTSLQTKIKLRIHKSLLTRVLDYTQYEDLFDEGNDYYLVNFPFIENEYYYNVILSFGAKCECLEPLDIRNTLKLKLLDMVSKYED